MRIKDWFKKICHFLDYFKDRFSKQRWLILVFGNDGLEAKRVIYYPAFGNFKEKKSFYFLHLSESNFNENKIFKIFVKLSFFPFSYKVMVVSSRRYCCSKYFTIHLEAKDGAKSLELGQLGSTFAQKLLPILEKNKKEFMKENKYEDLDVILASSQVVAAWVDGKSLENVDDVFSVSGKKFSIGLVQTFLNRNFFYSLKKIFPKRAAFREFHENNFSASLLTMLYLNLKSQKKIKKFIFSIIEEKETSVFVFNGEDLFYYDSFSFGWRSLYEALHHFVGLDITVFDKLLGKIISNDISFLAKKKVISILNKELNWLWNGLLAFKNETKIKNCFINGQKLNSFLKIYSKYARLILDDSCYNWDKRVIDFTNLDFESSLKADLVFAISLDKGNQLNTVLNKQIRWLIPHSIEIK